MSDQPCTLRSAPASTPVKSEAKEIVGGYLPVLTHPVIHNSLNVAVTIDLHDDDDPDEIAYCSDWLRNADIPATFLYGSSPDGQNATGASDEAQYYGKIDAERLYFLKPALLQLLNLLSRGTGEFEVEFPTLKSENFYDTARGFNHITKSFKDLVDAGILTPEEAKMSLDESRVYEKIKMIS